MQEISKLTEREISIFFVLLTNTAHLPGTDFHFSAQSFLLHFMIPYTAKCVILSPILHLFYNKKDVTFLLLHEVHFS